MNASQSYITTTPIQQMLLGLELAESFGGLVLGNSEDVESDGF